MTIFIALKTISIIFITLSLLIFLIALFISKFGRERTLFIINKFLSPICIIVFYLSNLSIISLFSNNPTLQENKAIRVAIDSAIITLIINLVTELLNSAVNISVDSISLRDINEVQTYMDKPVKVQCNISVDYKNKFIEKLCNNHFNIMLHIKNSNFTSIDIDKSEEYDYCVNCENSSKEIIINLNKISNSDKNFVRGYFVLAIMSNKSIKISDYITYEIDFTNRIINKLKNLLFNINAKSINVIHREGE